MVFGSLGLAVMIFVVSSSFFWPELNLWPAIGACDSMNLNLLGLFYGKNLFPYCHEFCPLFRLIAMIGLIAPYLALALRMNLGWRWIWPYLDEFGMNLGWIWPSCPSSTLMRSIEDYAKEGSLFCGPRASLFSLCSSGNIFSSFWEKESVSWGTGYPVLLFSFSLSLSIHFRFASLLSLYSFSFLFSF